VGCLKSDESINGEAMRRTNAAMNRRNVEVDGLKSDIVSDVYVHPQAICESETVGRGTRIWAFTHVMWGGILGEDCNIGEHVFIESGVVVGNRVTIKNGVQLWEGITLEDDVMVGPCVVFTNDRFPRSPRSEEARVRYASKGWLEPTVVRRGVSIGANSTILPGLEIGVFAMVGAGSLVTRHVHPHSLVVGAPARVTGYICACGQSLAKASSEWWCGTCERRYGLKDNLITAL
jgi:acetyltransferase-like isoleucine patch superfamily enzyme